MKEISSAIEVLEADLNKTAQMDDLLMALESYKTSNMGESIPYTEIEKEKLKVQFLNHTNTLVFLIYIDSKIAGCSVCFTSFSTFSAGNVINIHDFCIMDKYQLRGLGRKLLESIISKAESLLCSKITLEVREDNDIAKKLYTKFGFKDTTPIMHFWIKAL